MDELKVAWHKTLSAQTSQQLLLCMYPSISMMTNIKCLLYALEYLVHESLENQVIMGRKQNFTFNFPKTR